MPLEIYALLDTNDCPKKLKPSGSDEFYYYFPPPLPPFIVLFIVTKEIEEINYLFKISLCIDNDLDDKYIGEMGGDRPSICWNGDWTPEEISHAKTVSELGRALKLTVLKEELPLPEEEDELETEEVEEKVLTEEEKSSNEDELLKSSIAMLEDELDENESAIKRLNNANDERKKFINKLFKENVKDVNGIMHQKKKNKTPDKKSTQKKVRTPKKNASSSKEGDATSGKKATEVKSESANKLAEDTFEFVDETENVSQHIIAGRIGGKRVSPFGVLPKFAKKSYHETEDNKLKAPIPFSTPLSFSDILPTRNPSRRWGHAFCPLSSGKAIVIGGEGEKRVTNADSIWLLNTTESTWKSQQTDNSSIPRRVGHTACYDEKSNIVYVYGGTKHDKWFSDVYSLNLNTWKWNKIETIGKAPTRSYHSCTMDFDELLIFGGVFPTPAPNPDGCSNELLIFSTENKSWYTPIVSGDIPPGRSGHSACMLDRKLHIFGGWNAPQCFNDLYILDLGIMNFVKQKVSGSVPSPRTWHSSQLLSDCKRFCIYGGFNGEHALDDLYIFSSVENSWTKLFYPGLVCRAGHGVIQRTSEDGSSGDKLLVFGGGDNDGHFYNDLATLNLGCL